MMFSSGPRTNALHAIAPLMLLQLAAPGLAGALSASLASAIALRELFGVRKP